MYVNDPFSYNNFICKNCFHVTRCFYEFGVVLKIDTPPFLAQENVPKEWNLENFVSGLQELSRARCSLLLILCQGRESYGSLEFVLTPGKRKIPSTNLKALTSIIETTYYISKQD